MEGLITKRTNKLKSSEILELFQDNDIVMFNESWTSESSDLDVADFECIGLHRTRLQSARRDTGGLVIYIKSALYDSDMLVKKDGDDIIWLKFKPGIISENTVYLCLCYVLPAGATRHPFVETSVFDRLSDDIASFQSMHNSRCSFIVCGDMNARSKDLPDMVLDDNSLYLPLPDNYIVDYYIPRISQDKKLNSNGTSLLDFCKQTNLRILNGRFGTDTNIGKFTCHKHRGESVVDYVLASTDLLLLVCVFSVGDPNILSDHSIIEFSLSTMLGSINLENISDENIDFIYYTYKWDNTLVDDYKLSLSSEKTTRIFEQARSILSTDTSSTDYIDLSLNLIVEGIESCTKPLFSKPCHVQDSVNTFKDNSLPWFNNDCKIKRQEFYFLLNIYRTDRTDINRINMAAARSSFKKTLRKARFQSD